MNLCYSWLRIVRPFFSFDFFGFLSERLILSYVVGWMEWVLKMIDISEFNRIWMRIWWMTWECQMKESGGWCGQSWLVVCMCVVLCIVDSGSYVYVSEFYSLFLLGYWIIWRWIFLLVELLIKNDLYEIVN